MNLETTLAAWDQASQRCMLVLAHFLWQGSAVAAVAVLGMYGFRRQGSAYRYPLLVACLALMAACPVATWFALGQPGGEPLATGSALATGRTISPAVPAPGPDSAAAVPRAPSPPADTLPWHSLAAEHSAPDSSPRSLPQSSPNRSPIAEPRSATGWQRGASWLMIAYAAGVGLLLAHLLLGLHGGRGLCRTARLIDEPELLRVLAERTRAVGLRAAPALAYCGRVAVPTLVGVLRPTILIPLAYATHLTPDQWHVVLTHELTHLRRYDHLVNLGQRVIEAFLFFHPAVWWLSREIRREREYCCDGRVMSLGAQPMKYAQVLLRIAELSRGRREPTLVAVHAVRRPSELRGRIARILDFESPATPLRLTRIWPVLIGLLLVGFLPAWTLGLAAVARTTSAEELVAGGQASGGTPSGETTGAAAALSGQPPEAAGNGQPAGNAASQDQPEPEWGSASQGLQLRVQAVAPETDQQQPDFSAAMRQTQFARPSQATFLAQLKNVGDQPLLVQGTRYGDSVTPPWPGKSATEKFAPYLFDFELLRADGSSVDVARGEMLEADIMLTLSSGSAEKLAPSETLTMLVRPLDWNPALQAKLTSGEYRLQLTYHGPAEGVVKRIGEHWPDKDLADAWTGTVSAPPAAFALTQGQPELDLVWGPVVEGLQAAVALRAESQSESGLADTAAQTFPYGSRVDVRFHIRNTNDREISFWSPDWRQEDELTLIMPDGETESLGHGWYSGWQRLVQWTLEPGEVAVLDAIDLGIAADQKAADEFAHPIGAKLIVAPGTYKLQYELKFGNVQRNDAEGKVVVPGPTDWQQSLKTGETPITVRPRRPEDEPPRFSGRFRFQGPDGQPVPAGKVHVSSQENGKSLGEFTWSNGQPLLIEQCPFEALMMVVHAPGYEEQRLYDIRLRPNDVANLQLQPALPVTFRLVSRTGQPVASAKVRFFNRSKKQAQVGPYPSQGTEGSVWAESDEEGNVRLDMLQKRDARDDKLGDNIYWFYIEPADLAPRFIGPIEAGQDLGEIEMGPFLVVRGEVRGTPEELEAFSAEWDQPEPMLRGDGSEGWMYAESRPLETRREGDKLTFELRGVRPGRLRFVSRFQRGGQPVQHVFSRREPNEDDVVHQLEIRDSRNDVILQNERP